MCRCCRVRVEEWEEVSNSEVQSEEWPSDQKPPLIRLDISKAFQQIPIQNVPNQKELI